MTALLSLRPIAAVLAALLSVQSGAALALDAHSEGSEAEEVAAAPMTLVEFVVGDRTVAAQLPCSEVNNLPADGDDFQSSICIDGDQMYVFAVAQGDGANAAEPMVPNFDAAYREIEEAHDTVNIDVEEIDGRRTMRAERGPDPAFGVLQAVELREDAVVYVISMSRPGRGEPLDDAAKQVMRDFVNSLETR
mgnify:FL=1